jgi:predicted transposase YbfD/YdcC
MKLNKEQVITWIKKTDNYESLVGERIGYIVETIMKTFKTSMEGYGYDDERDLSVREMIQDEYMNFGINTSDNLDLIDKHGQWINLIDGIPQHWLWENFEEELENGRQKYIDQEKLKKQKAKQKYAENKIKKEKLLKSAKSKLTKEELKLL